MLYYVRTLMPALALALVSLAVSIGSARAQDMPNIEIVPSIGHSDDITSVAFSPDGKFVLSGSDDRTLKLWEAASGQLLRTFEGHAREISSVAFSPNGSRALSGGEDGMKLWDVETGRILHSFEGHSSGVRAVAISPDGSRVLSGGDSGGNNLKLWDEATGRLLHTFEGHSKRVQSVAFSPNRARVLSGSLDGMKLWDVKTGRILRTFEGHTDLVLSVAFSPDGNRILSGSQDGTMKLWNTATGQLLRTFRVSSSVPSAAFSPDGNRVLSSDFSLLKLWDGETGRLLRTFEGYAAGISVVFSPDGSRVLSGGRRGTLKLWDTASGRLLHQFEGSTDNSTGPVAFSPDKTRILLSTFDNSVTLIDMKTGTTINTSEQQSNAIFSVSVSPDGPRVLSESLVHTMGLWDPETGRLLSSFELGSDEVHPYTFSPDGRYMLVADQDDILQLWDVEAGKRLRTIKGAPRELRWAHANASFPAGYRVLSGIANGTLKLWDATNGRILRTFEGHSREVAVSPDGIRISGGGLGAYNVASVAVSPDGTRIVSGGGRRGDNMVKLWETQTGRLLHSFAGHTDYIPAVTFSPDGGRVLSGSQDRTLKLWDTASGRLLRTFEGHSHTVIAVAFSPDGSRVLSGSLDGRLKLWDVATGQLLRTFEATQMRPFSASSHRDASVAFSPDGSRVLFFNSDNDIVASWDLATGQLLFTFVGGGDDFHSMVFSPDGLRVLSSSERYTLNLWDAETGRLHHSFEQYADVFPPFALSHDGSRILSGGEGGTLRLWEAATGRLLRTFEESEEFGGLGIEMTMEEGVVKVISLIENAPAENAGLLAGDFITHLNGTPIQGMSLEEAVEKMRGRVGSSVELTVVREGRDAPFEMTIVRDNIRINNAQANQVHSVAFSPDGSRVLSVRNQVQSVTLSRDGDHVSVQSTGDYYWHTEDGRPLSTLEERNDLSRLHGLSWKLQLWDAATGQHLHSFEDYSDGLRSVAVSSDQTRLLSGGVNGALKLWDVSTGRLLRSFGGHASSITSIAFSPDDTHILSSGRGALALWEAATGQLVRTFEGHSGRVRSAAFSPDGNRVLSVGSDGTVRLWDAATGAELAVFIVGRDGQWLALTSAGFFASSDENTTMLGIVRGLESWSIAHFHDHLYRPDLVEALLSGDPEGKYADAASRLNLHTILDSGPAPQIEEIPGRKAERIGDTVKIALRLVDTGGGIGEKVVWRVNGVTQGEVVPPGARRRGFRVIEQTLQLVPGQENAIEVTAYNGAGLLATTPWRHVEGKFGERSGARMHVLAVGVSTYARPDWRLSYATGDAQAFGELMQAVGRARELYDDVQVSLVLENGATEEGIAAAIERIRGEVRAGDVFILYLAGHGRNIAGTYYFLPQDLTFEGGRTIQNSAIGQDRLQAWLARIPAQKSLLILDTCESIGAARDLATERETAVERLRYATGRSVIAAASAAAYEGYKGHGLLTWAIRDAFTSEEGGEGEFVDLLDLATHIDREVPEISRKWLGVVQRPHHRIEGNFPLGVRLAALAGPEDTAAIPKEHTHVLIRLERVRELPEDNAPGSRELSPGTQVRVLRLVGQWAVIAREGQELGYVPNEALLRLQ